MESIVTRQALWILGSKQQLLARLASLTRDYGPEIKLSELLALLQQ